MFVTANNITFTRSGIQSLSKGDKVQISSGMGGSYTLHVVSNTNKEISLSGGLNLPSYFRDVSYTLDEALSELFLLMPKAIYGVNTRHVALAIKAGYTTQQGIIEVICKTADTYAYLVKDFLTENKSLNIKLA